MTEEQLQCTPPTIGVNFPEESTKVGYSQVDILTKYCKAVDNMQKTLFYMVRTRCIVHGDFSQSDKPGKSIGAALTFYKTIQSMKRPYCKGKGPYEFLAAGLMALKTKSVVARFHSDLSKIYDSRCP